MGSLDVASKKHAEDSVVSRVGYIEGEPFAYITGVITGIYAGFGVAVAVPP